MSVNLVFCKNFKNLVIQNNPVNTFTRGIIMTGSYACHENKPFEEYKSLFKKILKNKHSKDNFKNKEKNKKADKSEKLSDEELFRLAVSDVEPVKGSRRICPDISCGRKPFHASGYTADETETVKQNLIELVESGEGFDVSKTPEYDELIGAGVPAGIARKLHSGRFSVQDYIDLHGMNSEDASDYVSEFLKKSFEYGKNAVLIVHGRGLSSPKEPVLKNMVRCILTSNYWRRRIYAYTSAKGTDGGAGGTYVLFRDKPLTKKQEKQLLSPKGKLNCI